MKLENTSGDGIIALPARILLDTLKEFSVQPLAFDINLDTLAVVITSENGKFNIMGRTELISRPAFHQKGKEILVRD